ncbi:uncharacterized protein LOC118830795 isoform X1 [Trichosurus vulpecula]|uniref:uncharacterized protein LOC118830795 isoform X1 n=1 Tax=Trichosurus vulpecula TaxID=9337 RepID=UPI00186B0268|nr:uncharacterized protein LOC118830795 isoform X1 [Trichosurus vulpecula]
MGRLDDHAKKRIVELRKAGLSFRKIKKVLELDNIRVTPQAVYLFLKRKNVKLSPLPSSNHPLPPRDQNTQRLALSRSGWKDEQLWDLLQESEVEPKESLESQPAGPRGEPGAGQSWEGKEGVRIVGVTSLRQDSGAHPKDTRSIEVPPTSANSKLPGPYRPVLVVVSNKEPKESLENQPAGPRGEPGAGQSWEGKEGIRIVSVTSLRQDNGAHPKDTCFADTPQASANSKLPGPYRPVLVVVSNKEPKESLESQPAGPRGEPGAGQSWEGKEGIRIVSVTSLHQDGGAYPKDNCSFEAPQASGNSDAGIGLGAPGPVSQPASPHPLSRGHNSALIVKKKIVDRAIFLHKKAAVQSVQRGTGSSSLPLLVGVQSPGSSPGLLDLKDSSPHVQDMGTQTRLSWSSVQGLAEKLDAVQGAVQQVLQVLQVLMDQQSRLERQQEQQQLWQQQVLGTLQQLRGSAQSQGPGNGETQDLGSPGTLEVPDFHQFKMEPL